MPKINYGENIKALRVGEIADSGFVDTLSLVNSDPQATKLVTATVGAAQDNFTYILTLLGIAVSYTSDGTATQQEIADGLTAAVNGNNAVNGVVVAVAGTNSFTLTGRNVSIDFSATSNSGDVALAVTRAAADAAAVRFGVAVVRTADRAGRLIASSDFVGARHSLVFTASNSQPYTLVFSLAGVSHTAIFTSDGTATKAEITTGLKAAIDALAIPGLIATPITAGDDLQIDAPQGQDLVITVATGGTGAITVTRNNGPSRPVEVLVALRQDIYGEGYVREFTADLESYPGNATMGGGRSGRFAARCEADPATLAGDVFVRVSADGALDTIGAFSGTSGTGKISLSALYPGKFGWHRGQDGADGVAVLQLNG